MIFFFGKFIGDPNIFRDFFSKENKPREVNGLASFFGRLILKQGFNYAIKTHLGLIR